MLRTKVIHEKDQRNFSSEMGAGANRTSDLDECRRVPSGGVELSSLADESGLSWPLPAELEDAQLERRFIPAAAARPTWRVRNLTGCGHTASSKRKGRHPDAAVGRVQGGRTLTGNQYTTFLRA